MGCKEFIIAETVKNPIAGMYAWSSEKNKSVIFDGEEWIELSMPLFMFTFKDLTAECQKDLIDWVERIMPKINAKKVLRTLVFDVTFTQVAMEANAHSLEAFFE